MSSILELKRCEPVCLCSFDVTTQDQNADHVNINIHVIALLIFKLYFTGRLAYKQGFKF